MHRRMNRSNCELSWRTGVFYPPGLAGGSCRLVREVRRSGRVLSKKKYKSSMERTLCSISERSKTNS
jgi:hypothetical protein